MLEPVDVDGKKKRRSYVTFVFAIYMLFVFVNLGLHCLSKWVSENYNKFFILLKKTVV